MSLLDKLPKLPFLSQETAAEEYFFALNIDEKQVIGAVWGIEGNKLRIISTAQAKYQSHEEIVEAANKALDEALADFYPEPTKVLFGVPEDWLQDENLKPEQLKFLKHLVKELDITPMAYVSTAHAISHFLQKQTSVPTTAVIVDISDPIQITVVKGGKVLASKVQKRSEEELPKDIEKALLSFSEIEVLPSKILIYGEGNLEKFKEEIASFSWMNQLPFLHLPKVEILDKDLTIKAVCLAGASELNPDVQFNPNMMGMGAKHQSLEQPRHTNQKQLEELGFVEEDISSKNDHNLEDQEQQHHGVASGGVAAGGLALIEKVKSLVPKGFKKSAHDITVPGEKNSFIKTLLKKKLVLIPALVVLLILGLYIFFSTAKVQVFIDMQIMENTATITADPAVANFDEANKKIPGKTVQTDITGSAKGQATGKKQIGDPAKGAVVIYNKTNSSQSLSSGTVLTGSNNLKFSLDNNVQIASQSAVDGGISFGKTTVNVTASQIGPDSNLPAGTELTVQGQSKEAVSAKADSAFSGGISKDVTIVTSEDQKKLLAQLTSDLRKQAKDQLQQKLPEEMKVIEEGLVEKIVKQSFSKNVNDQASEFNLNLTVNYQGTAYNGNDLKQLVSKLVQVNVPEGYELDLAATETQADVAKVEKDGKLIFNAKFKAKLKPKLSIDDLKKQIVFKTPEQATQKLKEIKNVIGVSIKLNPSLPSFLQRLPVLTKNIDLEVTAK